MSSTIASGPSTTPTLRPNEPALRGSGASTTPYRRQILLHGRYGRLSDGVGCCFPRRVLQAYVTNGGVLVMTGTRWQRCHTLGSGGVSVLAVKNRQDLVSQPSSSLLRAQGQADRRKITRCGLRKLATILFSIASAGTDARAVRPPARANRTPGADPAPPLPGNATAFEGLEVSIGYP